MERALLSSFMDLSINYAHLSLLLNHVFDLLFVISNHSSFPTIKRGNLIITSIPSDDIFTYLFLFWCPRSIFEIKIKIWIHFLVKFSLLLCSWLTFWGLISQSHWGIIILSCLHHFYSLPLCLFISLIFFSKVLTSFLY